ncbi:uncharacterized protein LOC114648038 [Erpetoichthys calabaricus]|uniref:uncharacterized protein LOC114648038 n=1 Tax=Erpetoichthys calabaricus TaxID=27687 RepID=UPI002234C280|nr:uncharacterized protein LOC114648038 [Erpetoichthys calabaricus]
MFLDSTRLKMYYEDLIKSGLQLQKKNNKASFQWELILTNMTDHCYMPPGAMLGNSIIINTTVQDCLLTGLHIIHILPDIWDIMSVDPFFNAIFNFLNLQKFNEAKILWTLKLQIDIGKNCFENDFIQVHCNIKDHLANFNGIKCSPQLSDGQWSGSEEKVYRTTMRPFEEFGYAIAFGKTCIHPTLVLVHIIKQESLKYFPIFITDDYGRDYALQFLIMEVVQPEGSQVALCAHFSGSWFLFGLPHSPTFMPTDLQQLKGNDCYYPVLCAYTRKLPNNV